MSDEVTVSRTFALSQVRASESLEPLDLPAGLYLTVQLVTSKSGAKKGQRYARVKLTNGSSTDIPLPALTTTLETRGPNATLSQSVSSSLTALPAGKTAYRSTKSVSVSSQTYFQICAVVTLEGITTPDPLEVCEVGSGPVPTFETTHAALELLAAVLEPNPTSEHSGWTWTAPSGMDPTLYLETLSFNTWLARQTQSPADGLTESMRMRLHRANSSV